MLAELQALHYVVERRTKNKWEIKYNDACGDASVTLCDACGAASVTLCRWDAQKPNGKYNARMLAEMQASHRVMLAEVQASHYVVETRKHKPNGKYNSVMLAEMQASHPCGAASVTLCRRK